MSSTSRFRTAARSHPGLKRDLNEDALLARDGLWAVADGMGGHQAGEVASSLIVASLDTIGASPSIAAVVEGVRARLQAVNDDLIDRARAMGDGAVIGSTVCVLMAAGDRFACAWAGDSRIYRLRRGELSRLTHDHSLVQELLDAGTLTEDDPRARRISNIVTRAVGSQPVLRLEETEGEVAPGDLFLLCTDGLSGVVGDAEIGETLRAAADLDVAADELIARTLARGAPDNVTLVLVEAQ